MARLPRDPKVQETINLLISAAQYPNRRPMIIGRYDSSGNLESDPTTGLPPGYVWVHDNVNPRVSTRAKNLRTEYAPGLAVTVAENVDTKENEVIGVDTIVAPEQYGAGAGGLNSPRKGASTPTPTSARDLITGGLYVHTGLTVRIGATRLPNGDDWDDTLTETLVPTATASMKSLVLVGVDLTDNTFTTAITADRATTIPLISSGTLTTLGATDAKAVTSAQPDIWWVAAVELANGATAIDSAKIVDRRLWTFPTMTGATNTDDGVSGLVPTPEAGDEGKFLGGDGTWKTVSVSGSVPAFGAGATVTLSSGVASAGSDRHLVIAAESGTADDLIEITGLSVGDEVIIRADSGDTITVKHNDAGATDKILLYSAADLALSGDKVLKLVKTESGKVAQYVDTGSSGGAFSQSYYGKNAIGASNTTMTTATAYLKKITLASAGLLVSIDVYVDRAATTNVQSLSAWVLADNAGDPGLLISSGVVRGTNELHISTTARWISIPVSMWLPAGDYWLAVQRPINASAELRIFYDASVGSDRTQAIGGAWTADGSQYTVTTTTNDYSIRASVLS